MRIVERSLVVLPAVALNLAAAGCATNPAPRGWLPSARAATQEAYGGWIRVLCGEGETVPCAEGELIAVESDRLVVLGDQRLVEVPHHTVRRAILAAYQTKEGALGGWTALGTLSTLSHGAWLLLSAPMWIISGSLATASESRRALLEYPKVPLSAFSLHARFPQGLPTGLDPSSLSPRLSSGAETGSEP